MHEIYKGTFFQNKFFRFTFFCLVSFFTLHFFYGPTVLLSFAQNDDYNYFRYIDRSSFVNHPQYEFIRYTGRHGYNILGYFLGKFVTELSDTVQIRIVIEFLLSIILAIFMRCTYDALKNPIISCLLILPIGFLPAFGASFLWITQAPIYFAILLGLSASAPLFSICKSVTPKSGLRVFDFLNLKNSVLFICSCLLLLAGIYVYPPWAYFLFVPVLINLLFNLEMRHNIRLFIGILAIIVSSISTFVFFVVHKFIYLPWYAKNYPKLFDKFSKDPAYAIEMTTDIFGRIQKFIHAGLPSAANLWTIDPSSNFWMFVIGLISIALMISVFNKIYSGNFGLKNPKKIILFLIGPLTIILGFLFISVAPIIFANGSHLGFRLIILFSVLVYLIGAWALRQIVHSLLNPLYLNGGGVSSIDVPARPENTILAALFISVVMFGGVTITKHTHASALNNLKEIDMIRNAVVQKINSSGGLNFVHIITPMPGESYRGDRLLGNGEFYFNSAWPCAPWIVSAVLIDLLGRGIVVEERALQEELVQVPGKVIVTKGLPTDPVKNTKNGLIIDLTALYSSAKISSSVILGGMELNASVKSKIHHVDRAFDNSVDSDRFWEFTRGSSLEPMRLDISFLEPKKHKFIIFKSGELTSRMPESWQLLGSNNKSYWQVLADGKKSGQYQPFEARKFRMNNKNIEFKYYRLSFRPSPENKPIRIYEIVFE